MRQRLGRFFLLIVLAMGLAVPATATPPPAPPPPRPFDDPALALRFEEWQQAFLRNVDDAAAKLAGARIAIRKADAGAVPDSLAAKQAREFALARQRSLESLRPLVILHAETKPAASAGDLQRLQETLNWWREWFTNTEPNSLEMLKAVTK
jgi:hypothetical protein